MPNPIRLVLTLHNHQPVGNFEFVFEQAYNDSYRPFLDVLAEYPSLKIGLHTSGSLMEWLDANHPDYVNRLADLAADGRIEILGGAFFEPILAMIPSRDRIGQIRRYTRWLEDRLAVTVRGMWVPERVWEQAFVRDIVDAGIEYTILDDFHFKCAGLTDEQLLGHLITEDEGRLLSVFPGNERLRYVIPFGSPEETIELLAAAAEQHPGATFLFGDDGEKFGIWPGTNKHVYQEGWLRRFFDALVRNQDWIQVTTPAEVIDNRPPVGKIYLPDCSYREMTEWALPTEKLVEYERIAHEMQQNPHWPALRPLVRGGFWRNFRTKYAEVDEMYARMMMVSRRVDEAASRETDGTDSDLIDRARTELYRGQCNCGYWHGAFGGVYLPHLRNAVYHHLIAADNLLDKAIGRTQPWVEAVADDFDFDTHNEIRLANDKLLGLIDPFRGGHLVELDVRAICHNLLATFTRKPEAYHRKILAGSSQQNGECASIHEQMIFKQEGLDQKLLYDAHPRKSMVDLFFGSDATLETVAAGEAPELGDFFDGQYETRIRRNPGRIQIQMFRQGSVGDKQVKLTKGVTLEAGQSVLRIDYLLEDLPLDVPLHFGVEFNFAGMPAGQDDRYFHDAAGNRLGPLGARLDLAGVRGLCLTDEHLGLDVALGSSLVGGYWTFPIETVSQSESGFELIHQSVAVIPHWHLTPDEQGRWSVTFEMSLDTAAAGNHLESQFAAVTE